MPLAIRAFVALFRFAQYGLWLRLCARFTARIRLRSPAIARWAIRRARFWGGCDGKVIDLKSLSNLRIYHTNISILSQMCLNARGLDDIIVLFL